MTQDERMKLADELEQLAFSARFAKCTTDDHHLLHRVVAALRAPEAPDVVAAVQEAIMRHPFWQPGLGSSAFAFGLANTAIKAYRASTPTAAGIAAPPAASADAVGDFCTFGPPGERAQQWIILFQDADRGMMVFDNEQDAHTKWDRAKDNWTCTLYETSQRKYFWAAGELRALTAPVAGADAGMRDALRAIDKIVRTPTSATPYKTAYTHYAQDFEAIRRLIKAALSPDAGLGMAGRKDMLAAVKSELIGRGTTTKDGSVVYASITEVMDAVNAALSQRPNNGQEPKS